MVLCVLFAQQYQKPSPSPAPFLNFFLPKEAITIDFESHHGYQRRGHVNRALLNDGRSLGLVPQHQTLIHSLWSLLSRKPQSYLGKVELRVYYTTFLDLVDEPLHFQDVGTPRVLSV